MPTNTNLRSFDKRTPDMAEKDLSLLLQRMNPSIQTGEFVFCSIDPSDFEKLSQEPLCSFKEKEGMSVVVEKAVADNFALRYSASWALITLEVTSDLLTVGFLSAITQTLADAEIPANVVSAYYHDHVFVPLDKATRAVEVLNELSDYAKK